MFIDMHCDTMLKIKSKFSDFEFNLNECIRGGGGLVFFACYVDTAHMPHPFARAVKLIENFKAAALKDGRIELCDSLSGWRTAAARGKCAAVITIEDCEILEGKIENLYRLYRMGARGATLTWNHENSVGGGCLSDVGLTAFGKNLVHEMQQLGMFVDVSHLCRRSFYDVMRITRKPVIATHSCSYDVFPHPRNLDKEQFKEIVMTGGGVGVCFYPLFLCGKKSACMDDVIRHTDFFLNLSNARSVGLGSDFDGVKYTASDLRSTKDIFTLGKRLGEIYGEGISNMVLYKNMRKILSRF